MRWLFQILLPFSISILAGAKESNVQIEDVIASNRVKNSLPFVLNLNSVLSLPIACKERGVRPSRPNFCELGKPGDLAARMFRAKSFCNWSSELETKYLNSVDEDTFNRSKKGPSSLKEVVAEIYSSPIQIELQKMQKQSGANIIKSLQLSHLSSELVEGMVRAYESISVAEKPVNELPFRSRNGGAVGNSGTQLDYSPSYRLQSLSAEGRSRMDLFITHEMAHLIAHPVRDQLLQTKIGNQTVMQCAANQFHIPPPPRGANWLMEPRFSEAIADIFASVALGSQTDKKSVLQWESYIRENLSSLCEDLKKLEPLSEPQITELYRTSSHPAPWDRIDSLMKNKKIREKIGCVPIANDDGVCGLY